MSDSNAWRHIAAASFSCNLRSGRLTMNYIITVDGGTSNTRTYLWTAGGKILTHRSQAIGAKTSAINGSNQPWKQAIHDMIESMLTEYGISEDYVQGVYMSGMLTSDLGILEVPHLTAPVSMKNYQEHLVRVHLPEVFSKEIVLIPGIKNTLSNPESLDSLRTFDIMRGEETETYALIEQYGSDQNTIYILPGSHNKYVFIDENCTVLATSTTLSGELLNSIVNDTIVASSVDHGFPSMEHYNLEMIQYGCEMHRKEGFGRALFLTRLFDRFGSQSKYNLQNYVLGIVLESDLTALHNAAFFKDVTNVRIVIHGNGAFSHALYDLLKEDPAFHNIVLDDSEEIPIAAQGAFHLAMKDLQTH